MKGWPKKDTGKSPRSTARPMSPVFASSNQMLGARSRAIRTSAPTATNARSQPPGFIRDEAADLEVMTYTAPSEEPRQRHEKADRGAWPGAPPLVPPTVTPGRRNSEPGSPGTVPRLVPAPWTPRRHGREAAQSSPANRGDRGRPERPDRPHGRTRPGSPWKAG